MILFVDDDFMSNTITCDALRDSGFDVIGVYCALTACEVIKSHPHLLALATDIDLGPGADGFELARYARAVYPHLPVVYMSGMAAARFPFEGVGDSEFIAKPFCPQQIIDALGRVIRLEAA